MTTKTSPRLLMIVPVAVLILGYSLSSDEPFNSAHSIEQGSNEYGSWLKYEDAYFNYSNGYDISIYNKKNELGMAIVQLDKSCRRPSVTSAERTISFNEIPINFKHSCIEKNTASLFPLTETDEERLFDVFTYKYGVILNAGQGEQAFFKTEGVNDVITFLNNKYL
ncbi:hypothetical protein [Vibrio sp. 10N.247.311.51]|uniref:hypothetical protein n=1 Tax=Vibrio sp. 10N.247.311.51 TaxID=3229996 RepID=UPI0035521FCD